MKISAHHFTTVLSLVFIFDISHAKAEISWVQPTMDGWNVIPLLNTGQPAGNSYRMAGIPDGMGAFKSDERTITILMNHELPKDKGIKRTHGAIGAFVSRWQLDIENLKIVAGSDQIQHVMSWSVQDRRYIRNSNYQFNKLCSADLAPVSAFYNAASGNGYQERLLLNGEENKQGGRAFAHIVTGEYTGTSYELPHLGKLSWENALANPASGDVTLVAGTDDNADGQVYLYIGEKRHDGNPVEKAGLTGGTLYAVKAAGNRFGLVSLGDVSELSGEELENAGKSAGASKFKRPEDGAWDTRQPKLFYFATTDTINGESQIIQLRFDDLTHPEKGGDIKAVLDARTIGAQMFDNLTVTADGKLLITEDPGNHEHLSSVWFYDPLNNQASRVLQARPEFFKDKTSKDFITQDEENSGVIEITDLVKNASWFEPDKKYFLGNVQVHQPSADPELVEDGQLYLMSAKYQ